MSKTIFKKFVCLVMFALLILSSSGLMFAVSANSINHAIIHGDGFGRPDRIRLNLNTTVGISPTDYDNYISEVRLVWPPAAIPSDATTYTVRRATMVARFAPTAAIGSGAEMIINLAGLTANDGVTTLPNGYTSISGNGMGTVSVVFNGTLVSNFNTYDGLGPIIADNADQIAGLSGPMVVENPFHCQSGPTIGCRHDTLFIQVSEPVRQTLGQIAEPGTFQIVRTTGGINPNTAVVAGILPLRVTSALPSGSINGFRLVLDPATPLAPRFEGGDGQYNYWIRFVPEAAHVEDFASKPETPANNNPHANNRWVRFEHRHIQPVSLDAWYTANPRTGLIDTATIVFNKTVRMGWYIGSRFQLGVGSEMSDVVVTAEHFTNGTIKITNLGGGSDSVIKICLRTFWSDRRNITTSGMHNLSIRYSTDNQATSDWETANIPLTDRAAPVLVNEYTAIGIARARLKLGAGNISNTLDTIIVRMSEMPQFEHSTQPLTLVQNVGSIPLTLDVAEARAIMGGYVEMKYLVSPDIFNELNIRSGLDSIRITVGGITDQAGNVQNHPENRAVPIFIERIPVTVRANDKIAIVGSSSPTYTVSYSGWFGNDNENNALITSAVVTASPNMNLSGTYPITFSTQAVLNSDQTRYELIHVDGKLTVTVLTTLREFLNSVAAKNVITYSSELGFMSDGYTDALVAGNAGLNFGDNESHYAAAVYKIALRKGNQIKIYSSKENDSYLYIYTINGAGDVEYVVSNDDGGSGLNSYIDFTAASDNDYYLVITDHVAGIPGNYHITVWNTDDRPTTSILNAEREIMQVEDIAIITPVERARLPLVVGPNPVDRDNGVVRFSVNEESAYLGVSQLTSTANYSGNLTIFDNNGNIVRRISVVSVPNVLDDNRRIIAEWDLRDARGRLVSDGTYLVRGIIETSNGNRERVSALVGVR